MRKRHRANLEAIRRKAARLAAFETRVGRYKRRDGKWGALLLWSDYRKLLRRAFRNTNETNRR